MIPTLNFFINTTKLTLSSILYYITGHGYGHAIRAGQVISSLQRRQPDVRVHVRTTAPEWLFDAFASHTPQAIDVGIVQSDSLNMDLERTFRACRNLHDKLPEVIEKEISFIRQSNVGVIVGDIPPLCFEIAEHADIPSIAVMNFTWDWIYRSYLDAFPQFLFLIEEMENFYSKATLALTLPYPGNMDVFPQQRPIPWITRVSSLTREEARAKLGLPRNATIALLSFGGMGLAQFPLQSLVKLQEFFFVATGPQKKVKQNLAVLPTSQQHYEDLVRAVDVVVTKPGYGIVADVIAHQVPILYTDRGNFPEYPLLVSALKQMTTEEVIPQAHLLAGELRGCLQRLLAKEPNWPPAQLTGAEIAAEEILAVLNRK